jgi:hypothetical protein
MQYPDDYPASLSDLLLLYAGVAVGAFFGIWLYASFLT